MVDRGSEYRVIVFINRDWWKKGIETGEGIDEDIPGTRGCFGFCCVVLLLFFSFLFFSFFLFSLSILLSGSEHT